jgi:hypothetical protein
MATFPELKEFYVPGVEHIESYTAEPGIVFTDVFRWKVRTLRDEELPAVIGRFVTLTATGRNRRGVRRRERTATEL